MTIDEIFIALGLKSDGVKKGMKEAESAVSQGVSSITSKLSALGAAFTAAMSLGVAFNKYVEQADAMGKLADAIGENIEKIDAWGEATARAGGSSEAFQASLQSLTGQLARVAVNGTSRTGTLLENAGIDAGGIGRQRKAFDVLMDLARKAKDMSKEEFFGLGRSLGLDQGTIMFLQQGEVVVKDQLHLMKELGVYTKDDAIITAQYNDAMANLGKAFRSFAGIAFRMVLPSVKKIIDMFTQAVVFLRKHETFVQAFFISIATAITTMLIPAFVKLTAAMLANPLTWIIAMFAGLALVIEDLVVWAKDGESALADLWTEIFESPEEARKTWAKLKDTFENVFGAVKENLPEISTFGEALVTIIKLSFEPLMMLIRLFRLIRDTLEEISPAVREAIAPLAPAFKEAFNIIKEAWEDLKQSFSSGIDSIKSWFSSLGDVIKNAFGSALDWAKEKWNNTIGSLKMPSFGGEETKAHADGGIFNSPHMGIVAEDGAEAIIPLSAGKKNRALDLLGKIAGNFVDISAAQALPMGGASTVNNTTDTRVNVGTVNINAADGTDAANQFMTGIETRAARWTAAANVAY